MLPEWKTETTKSLICKKKKVVFFRFCRKADIFCPDLKANRESMFPFWFEWWSLPPCVYSVWTHQTIISEPHRGPFAELYFLNLNTHWKSAKCFAALQGINWTDTKLKSRWDLREKRHGETLQTGFFIALLGIFSTSLDTKSQPPLRTFIEGCLPLVQP